jgi:alpha-N-acetylglucosaminidase
MDRKFLTTAGVVAVSTLGLLKLVRSNASSIYDVVIFKMTSLWYSCVLDRISNACILDIGVGNATSLLANTDSLKEKSITVKVRSVPHPPLPSFSHPFIPPNTPPKGVDFTQHYVDAAQKNIASKDAASNVSVVYGSVYDLPLLKSLAPKGPNSKFDAVYFSGSISLLPDPLDALRTVAKVLKKGGFIYVTQTYQHRNIPGLATFKRNMKFFTTIDFGELTFEKDIMEIYKSSGYEIVEPKPIEGSVDNAFQTAYLTILKPA